MKISCCYFDLVLLLLVLSNAHTTVAVEAQIDDDIHRVRSNAGMDSSAADGKAVVSDSSSALQLEGQTIQDNIRVMEGTIVGLQQVQEELETVASGDAVIDGVLQTSIDSIEHFFRVVPEVLRYMYSSVDTDNNEPELGERLVEQLRGRRRDLLISDMMEDGEEEEASDDMDGYDDDDDDEFNDDEVDELYSSDDEEDEEEDEEWEVYSADPPLETYNTSAFGEDVVARDSESTHSTKSASSFYARQNARHQSKHKHHFEGNTQAVHKHRFLNSLQDAIMSGNHDHLTRVLTTVKGKVDSTTASNSGRRLQPKTKKQKETDAFRKAVQCKQLTFCAKGMSYYDMLVYYYSDDIDPATGEIDDSILHFDEKDLVAKHDKILRAAQELYKGREDTAENYMDGTSAKQCDNLLELFHRNVEFNGVPHWEGGTVSQVCFAEGSQAYLKLDQIALKVGTHHAVRVADDIFQCSKELYNSEARSKSTKEPFPLSTEALMKEKYKKKILFESEMVSQTGPAQTYDFFRSNVFDNDISTRWRSHKSRHMQTVVAKMKKESWVNALEIHWGKDRIPRHYEIQVSKDGKNFERIFDSRSDWRKAIEHKREVWTPRAWKGRLEHKWTRVHSVDGLKPSKKSNYMKVISHGDKKRRFSLYEVFAFQVQERDDFTALRTPTGLNLSNRNEHGQIQDISKQVFTYSPRTDDAKVNEIVGILSRMYQIYAEKVESFAKGGSFSVDSSKTWENHAYYQADNALRLLQFIADDKVDDGNPRGRELLNKLGHHRDYVYNNLGAFSWKHELSQGFKDIRSDAAKIKGKFTEAFSDIQYGFDLVYGEKTTVGFVCGVREAVVWRGKDRWPGTCCLDAPFQNSGDNWGREHDCSLECKTPGPFFAGINEEACSANGGSWCPNPTDCSVLKQCIDVELESAKSKGKVAYFNYLEPAQVGDAHDADSCGDARSYFGFDPRYSNDEDICDNVRQLHNTKNFGFLDEFFKQGSASVKGGPDMDWEPLNPPDRARSESDGVVKNEKWKSKNFAIEQTLDPIKNGIETLMALKCPGDAFGIIQSACASITNAIFPILEVAATLLNVAYKVAEFARKVVGEPGSFELLKAFENTAVLFGNLLAMDTNLKSVFNGVKEVGSELLGARNSTDLVREEMKAMEQNIIGSHRALKEAVSNEVVLQELSSLQTKVGMQEERFDNLDAKLKQQQERFDTLDAKVDSLASMMQKLLNNMQGGTIVDPN